MGGYGYSGVLEGLKLTAQKEAEAARLKAEQERLKLDQERLKAQSQLEMEKLGQEQRQFNLRHELNVKAADLVKKEKELEFMEREAELSPASIAERESARLKPREESEIRTIQAQGEQQRLTQKAAREGEFPYEQWLTEFKEANANYRSRLAANTDLQTASMRISMESAMDSDALMSYYQGMADGTYNQDDIRKMAGPKVSLQLFGAAAKTGVVPLKKQQSDSLGDIPLLLQTIGLVDQFIRMQPDVGENFAAVKGRGAWDILTNVPLRGLEKQVKSQALIAAQILAKQPGRALSDQDRKAFDEGQLPRLMNSKKNNTKLRNDMLKAAKNLFDAITYNLSDEQKKLIIENYNLTDLVSGPSMKTGGGGIEILSIEPVKE